MSKIMDPINRAHDWIWERDLRDAPIWQSAPLRTLRIIVAVIRDLRDGQLSMRAMSLVYTTLITLVPLLAISFSVLKGFGVHNQLEPVLNNMLQPLGDKGEDITARVIEFVDNIRVGVLGAVGLGLLLYTVINLMQKIESAFNYTWRVSQPRSLAQRFSDYLSVLLVGPLLLFVSVSATASLRTTDLVETLAATKALGPVFDVLAVLVPYLFMALAFTFIYMFMPNARVKLGAAFIGGLFAALMWKVMGWLFSAIVAGSNNFEAIYAAFAALIIFMIWMYLAWLVVLVGASIAFYFQYPSHLMIYQRTLRLSGRVREKLGAMVCYFMARAVYDRSGGLSAQDLANKMSAPLLAVQDIVDDLKRGGLISFTSDTPPRCLLAVPPDSCTLGEVIDALRASGEGGRLTWDRLQAPEKLEAALQESFAHATGRDTTLRELVCGPEDPKPFRA